MEQYECVFFYVDGLYREKVTFEIEYEMHNAALRYLDCSELYLCMYSEETIKHLESFRGQILFKNEDMPNIGNYEAHTYGTNSHEFAFQESATLNPGYYTFFFELDENDLKFRPYNEYIEFDLISFGTDRYKFTDYAPANDYSDEVALDELRYEQAEYEALKTNAIHDKLIVFILCFAFSLILLKTLLNADNNVEKKYNFYTPSMQMDYFRDIPSNLDPTFAANLVFCKEKPNKEIKDGYAAIMLSLVRKGYIELARINNSLSWSFYNVKIIVKYQPQPIVQTVVIPDPVDNFFTENQPQNIQTNEIIEEAPSLEPLTPTEEHYFNLIRRHAAFGIEISMSSFQSKITEDYENTDSFVKNIESSIVNIGISQGYFQKANYKEPSKKLLSKAKSCAIMGILLLVVVNLISYHTRLDLAWGGYTLLGATFMFGAYIYRMLSKKYVLLTQFGEDEYVKWRGLYNFLNSETLINERTVIELPIWEQYLVYATAFGISDKVIAALNIRCPEIANDSPILSNSYYRSRSFYSSSRTFRSSARTASHAARSGGYGGGSWRIRWRRPWRRWWPEEVTKT